MSHELLLNPALLGAIVLGLFAGAALVLTVTYSRRGPMIYLPYAGLLAAVAVLLSRYPELSFISRFAEALAGFVVATVPLYGAVRILSARARERRHREGRLPPPVRGLSTWGRAWRLAFVFVLGMIVSAGVAFVAA